MSVSMRRNGPIPPPIDTSFTDDEPIIPPLDAATEKELRKSCSLLLLPKTSPTRLHSPSYTTTATTATVYSPAPPRSATAVKADLRASTLEIRRVATPDLRDLRGDRTSAFLLAKPTLVDVLPSPTRPRTAGTFRSSVPQTPIDPPAPAPAHAKSDSAATASSKHSLATSSKRAESPLQQQLQCDSPRAESPRPKTGLREPEKPMERPKTGHERRLSLFPRPRTATGGTEPDRPLPPLPSKEVKIAEDVVKAKKKGGFTQVAAFWKATFRFGRATKKECSVVTVP